MFIINRLHIWNSFDLASQLTTISEYMLIVSFIKMGMLVFCNFGAIPFVGSNIDTYLSYRIFLAKHPGLFAIFNLSNKHTHTNTHARVHTHTNTHTPTHTRTHTHTYTHICVRTWCTHMYTATVIGSTFNATRLIPIYHRINIPNDSLFPLPSALLLLCLQIGTISQQIGASNCP